MNSEKKKNNTIAEDIYSIPKNYGIRLVISFCAILFLGFACHVSISPKIKEMVAVGINQNKNCPMYYDQLAFSG